MARKVKRKKPQVSAVAVVIALVLIIAIFAYAWFGMNLTPGQFIDWLLHKDDSDGSPSGGGFNGATGLITAENVQTISEGDFSVHFLELGNNHTGDCIYLKAGDNDILIDAGSQASSIPTIKSYLDLYVADNTLEYVIATHAHKDHIDGFAGTKTNPSLFTLYDCEIIIDFPRSNNVGKSLYNKYIEARNAEVEAGATHYTALECWNNQNGAQRTYQLSSATTMTVLYQKFYEEDTGDENDYSVCLLFTHDSKNYLFTGDLEAEGESSLVASNSLPEVELYKAGHHGSKTSSSNELLAAIRPKIVCVCCCAGNDEYTDATENQFPTQAFIDRVAPYTDAVYVTTLGDVNYMLEENKQKEYQSFNGNIVLLSNVGSATQLFFSNNADKLKDTAWFRDKRTMPQAWQ